MLILAFISLFCMDAAKSLTEIASNSTEFPDVHIIFSDTEEGKIPDFLKYSGKEYSYQIMEFYNPDDDINSYLEVLGFEYENPVIIYYNNGNQMRFYDGTGEIGAISFERGRGVLMRESGDADAAETVMSASAVRTTGNIVSK